MNSKTFNECNDNDVFVVVAAVAIVQCLDD